MNKCPLYKTITLMFSLCLISFFTSAQKIVEPPLATPEWSKEYPPFRIVGNVYYVGTYDLACYLITTSEGNILINTGLLGSMPMIKAHIETLGFRFSDTKILLTTQAHFDHMGAMAAIKKATGARLLAEEKDADVMADGGKSDYALGGDVSSYEPVKADQLLRDGAVIALGDMKITMIHQPGHTKGSCSYIFDVKDETRSYKVLIANMPTIVTEKSLSNIPDYPTAAKDYAYTFNSLKNQQFDIWLSSHANQFSMHKKHKTGDAYNPAVFIDRAGYDEAIRKLEVIFNRRMSDNK